MTSKALGGLLQNYGPSKRQKLFVYPPELSYGDDNKPEISLVDYSIPQQL